MTSRETTVPGHPAYPAESPPGESVADRLARLRRRVADLLAEIRRRFEAGTAGIPLLATMSALVDRFVVDLAREAASSRAAAAGPAEPGIESCGAVVAVGGSGRGEMAPFSDVDLLFLHRPGPSAERFKALAGQIVRDVWDSGLKLGHSLRTVDESAARAASDVEFATSLIETRCLWGDETLHEALRQAFRRRAAGRRGSRFIAEVVASRRAEYQKHGGAEKELEPDVKRGAGGLRDVQLVRWLGWARYGTTDLDMLRIQGVISRDEVQTLLEGHEFLARVRIDLHLAAGKPSDVLSRAEQLRIATARGIPGTAGQSPVEVFMQQYFRQTTAVARVVRRFVDRVQPRPWWAPLQAGLFAHRFGPLVWSRGELDVAPRHRKAVCSDWDQVFALFGAMQAYQARLAPGLMEALQRGAPDLPVFHGRRLAKKMLAILQRPAHLGPVLRTMLETGVLERALPEFAHARCLLQFNQYHSYTVDEHTLRAVEILSGFEHDTGPIGDAYRAIHRKDILHLAMLLHDAGKGFDEDHSEVGKRLAQQVAERWERSPHTREILVFLVHRHLLMAHLAFRRDVNDPDVLLPFSREVGSPEILRMLYVLTAADITAVGPDVWTNWKGDLLAGLYHRTLQVLSGESATSRDAVRLSERRTVLASRLAGELPADWLSRTLDSLPEPYLLNSSIEQAERALREIHRLAPGEVVIHTAYDPALRTHEYRIITHESIGAGCFSKMCGALTARRLEILSAQIYTSKDGIVLDSFQVADRDYEGAAPPERYDDVAETIRGVLTGRLAVADLFRSHRRFGGGAPSPVTAMETRVVIDDESSDRFTIIDVFAHDRTGLLHLISSTLHALGLSIVLAKISTHLDQIVDVFYVTDAQGKKLTAGPQLQTIRDTLERRINEFA